MSSFVNIAAYQFVTLNELTTLRATLLAYCQNSKIKGTILLAPEGINLFLAGTRAAIDGFLALLKSDSRFANIPVKESYSNTQPFTRMLIKLKKEIITFRKANLFPERQRAKTIDAKTLKRWLDQQHDDQGKALILLDTRNQFEVEVGTFDHAIDFKIKKFTEFAEKVKDYLQAWQDKTIVSFCTGGIRCEKAGLYMQNLGFNNTVQLDGGILKYFEEVGGAHYHGDCFVFDYRTALDSQLQPNGAVQCFACRAVVDQKQQQALDYIPGKSCQHCASSKI